MEMEKRLGGGFLLEHLERADYLDCLFLLAEHYSGERQYVLAAERLNAFYADDSKSRYPRHYLAEVVRRLKDLYLRKLPRSAGAQDAIEGLESARRLGLTKAEELLRLRKLIEIQTRAGRLGDARESLLRARKLDPKGRGLAKAEAAISLAARKAE
jgi:hypothetical protein